MKKKGQTAEKEYEKLIGKIQELRDRIEEEFDMLELVEDSIKEIFMCDLECQTCTEEERGICMQNFKKGNIYLLRKILQDEEILHKAVEQINEMVEVLREAISYAKEMAKQRNKSKVYDIHKEEIKNKLRDDRISNFYS